MPEPSTPLDTWLGLHPAGGAKLGVRRRASISRTDGGLFGGVALGAAVRAAELHTGQGCMWAAVQFLNSSNDGAELELEALTQVQGRRSNQLAVTARDHRGIVFAAMAATAQSRPSTEPPMVWRRPPSVPQPDACPPRYYAFGIDSSSINTALDVRIASGRGLDELNGPSLDGRCALWARIVDLDELDGLAALGVVADHVPFACSQALGRAASAMSFDNTIRAIDPQPVRWALLDITIESIANGVAHGTTLVWGPDKALLAVASQSCRVVMPSAERG